jgi:serine/threonine protein kinase
LSCAEFKRAVVDLAVIDAEALDRAAAGFDSDVNGLARHLARLGTLTEYQAAAICQGKARGLVVGNYLVLERLGKGGMGVVFRARHRRLGRIVALKILPPSFARDPTLVLRFRREVQAATLLDHPNIVKALDADEDRGVHFLTMDYIEGRDLDHLVREGGVCSVAAAVDYVIQAARGLDAAHAQGIIHRDIKPGNLMLDHSGTVRVLDLGLALLGAAAALSAQTAAMTLTRSGSYMGTVDFMAPEQADDSHKVDHRADIYSLACTLYFLLNSRPPFNGPTPLSRLIAHQQAPAPLLRVTRPDVTLRLEEVYGRMMAKRPDDRPGSMAEVLRLLGACGVTSGATTVALSSLVTLSDTPREREVPFSGGEESTQAASRDESTVALVVAAANLEASASRDAPSSRAPRLCDDPAQPLYGSDHTGASTRRRRAALLSLGVPAVLVAVLTVYALHRARMAAQAQSDRPQENVTREESKGPVQIGPGLHDAPALDVVSNETAVTGETTGGPSSKDPGAGSAAVVSGPKREIEARDESRIRNEKQTPRLSPAAGAASSARVPAFYCVHRFRGHKGMVRSVAVSSDGRSALSTGNDSYAILWDIGTGKEIKRLDHPSEVLDAALSADGLFALTGTKGRPGTNGAIRLWNLSTRKPVVKVLEGAHVGPIDALALFPDGRALSGGRDGRVVL